MEQTLPGVYHTVVDEMNTTAPINRLSFELMSEIMVFGLLSPRTEPSRRWAKNWQYLRTLGAVARAWRYIRDDTAVLWTFIFFKAQSKDRARRQGNLILPNLFLRRSKGALLDFVLVFDSGWSVTNSRPLPLSQDHIARFHRLSIFLTDGGEILWFPLPSGMRNLRILEVHQEGHSKDDFPLFRTGAAPHMTIQTLVLSWTGPRALSSISTAFITSLDFRAVAPSSEALSFCAQCPALTSLSLASLSNLNEEYPETPVYIYSSLISLNVEDHFPLTFPHLIHTPRLRHLHVRVDSTTSEHPREPSKLPYLHTLCLSDISPNSEVRSFITHQKHIRALEMRFNSGLSVISLLGFVASDPTIIPTLRLIRIYHPKSQYYVSNFVIPYRYLRDVVVQRPSLKFDVHIGEWFNDIRQLSHPEILSSSGSVTTCVNDVEPCYTPLNELFAEEEEDAH